jgi:hypothetical protein
VTRARQVSEARTGSDALVLRQLLTAAEREPQVAGVVLAALYAQAEHDPELTATLTRAEEAPAEPQYAPDPDTGRLIFTRPVAEGPGIRVYSYRTPTANREPETEREAG